MTSTTWVALLRGINVGKAKRIAMGDLRTVVESLGYENVKTHGQSGNVVLYADEAEAELVDRISTAIAKHFATDVVVLARSAEELAAVVEGNPFAASSDPKELHFAFLSHAPAAARVEALSADSYRPDEFAFGDRVIYTRQPNGTRGTNLPNWEAALGVRVTVRNWNTTTKLRDLTCAS